MSTAIIATNNLFGHYSSLLIEHFREERVSSSFPRKLEYDNIYSLVGEEDTTLVIVGFPYYKSQRAALEDTINELALVGNPFTEVTYISTWGDEIDIEGVHHIFKEGVPLTNLVAEYITRGTEMINPVDLNVGGKKLVKYLEEYHNYEFLHHKASAPLSLKLLSDVYGQDVSHAVELTDTDIHFDPVIRDALYRKMENYIRDKLGKVETKAVNGKVVLLVYAEEHHNEIAHKLIDAYSASGFKDVIVLVGKQTRGDDMFHIRVSSDLDAGKIAKVINNGRGNEHAATVFLGKPRAFVMNSIEEQLSNYL